MAYSARVRNDVQMAATGELIPQQSSRPAAESYVAPGNFMTPISTTTDSAEGNFYSGPSYGVEDFENGIPQQSMGGAFPPQPPFTGVPFSRKNNSGQRQNTRASGQQPQRSKSSSTTLPSESSSTPSHSASTGTDVLAAENASETHPSPPVAGALQPGLLSVPHLNTATVTVNDSSEKNETDVQGTANKSTTNAKEKTPMCLINELARYNKIAHQYVLSDEQGPAHHKTFFVTLKLDKEEYHASGTSIKAAQHAAARAALETTKLSPPPPKTPKQYGNRSTDAHCVTPTVELNALAMKRSLQVEYRPMDPNAHFQYPMPSPYNGGYNVPEGFPAVPQYQPRGPQPGYARTGPHATYYVSLRVGQREFVGEGRTRQLAKHNAAAKALRIFRQLPEDGSDSNNHVTEDTEAHTVVTSASAAAAASSATVNNSDTPPSSTSDNKSEISLVHEAALKRGQNVNFETCRETGPPHMRLYAVRCTFGELKVEGEGASKRVAKQIAAKLMLEQIKTLPPLPPPPVNPSYSMRKMRRYSMKRQKKSNIVKVAKAEPDYGQGIHPVSRLIQIQQAKKEKEPSYKLLAEQGSLRSREFIMEVTVGDIVCQGVGPNKKLAKRRAAENMLTEMGYSQTLPAPAKPAIRTSTDGSSAGEKHVKFVEAGHSNGVTIEREGGNGGVERSVSVQTTANIARELLNSGISPTAQNVGEYVGHDTSRRSPTVSPKEQLLYLTQVIGEYIDIKAFPQDDKYLALVTLNTGNHRFSHGTGNTVEEAENAAAKAALEQLANSGLQNLKRDDAAQSSLADAAGEKGAAKDENRKIGKETGEPKSENTSQE